MAFYTGLVEFGWTFVFQVVNFVVIFLLLKKFLFKPVRKAMTDRQEGIENTINEADGIKSEALALKAQYEEKLENIKSEAREILKTTRTKADANAREIVNDAQAKATQIIKRGEEEIARENVKAMNELKDQVASIALMAAERIIEKQLDPKEHDELIKKFVEEVGEKEWQS